MEDSGDEWVGLVEFNLDNDLFEEFRKSFYYCIILHLLGDQKQLNEVDYSIHYLFFVSQ
jgi:hypothetical protein